MHVVCVYVMARARVMVRARAMLCVWCVYMLWLARARVMVRARAMLCACGVCICYG